MTDLDQQLREIREELTLLSRRVQRVAEAADEIDRTDVVDGLSDVQLALNDAAEAFEAMRER
ncbi:hypothetical protein SIM91_02980 [Rhodococcus opacus]|uniref:hypothetical protein n=1 Tax=Rhodococcus opacus TaxID=37919 RepID=UPI0007CD8D8D|nr:hypothetical protein [Rhodococcus opacus]MDX5962307.1 hypothetical protein [Rhodococcus opacus]NKY76766.1 hypothetical protein [Rhodococcus opacus]CAG7642823.1 hypothetical protein E143388_08442 [Rhodococcus opacus]